jgi:hypothetical protein
MRLLKTHIVRGRDPRGRTREVYISHVGRITCVENVTFCGRIAQPGRCEYAHNASCDTCVSSFQGES